MWKSWTLISQKPEAPPDHSFQGTVNGRCCEMKVMNNDESRKARIIELPSATPTTPPGLKPRPSLSMVMSNLNLNGDSSLIPNPPSAPKLLSQNKRGQQPPLLPTSSILSSPVVSTSSFYSGRIATNHHHHGGDGRTGNAASTRGGSRSMEIAASPVLLPGQARTAVGALVASATSSKHLLTSFNECCSLSPARTLPSWSSSSHAVVIAAQTQQQHSILPPRHDDYLSSNSPLHARSSLSPPPLISSSRLIQYYSSDFYSHSGLSYDPEYMNHLGDDYDGMNEYDGEDDDSTDENSSIYSQPVIASPSSLMRGLQMNHSHPLKDKSEEDNSNITYESTRNKTPVSNTADNATLSDEGSPSPSSPENQIRLPPTNDDIRLKNIKTFHQRQAHEDFLVAVLERFQDNVELVYEIQRQMGESVEADSASIGKTEGLLTGLSETIAKQMSSTLHAMLQEIDVSNQLYFSSPTDIASYSDPHTVLRDALKFCLQLVKIAALPQTSSFCYLGESKWNLLPGVKASLGFSSVSPMPTHRGGDTSVFTLPCDDSANTPMTSNVSITTTITTWSHASQSSPNHRSRQIDSRSHQQIIEVRQSISLVAGFLDRLSKALFGDKLQPQQIKKVYLEIQSMDLTALKSVAEAFEMERPDSLPELFSRSQSTDDNDDDHASRTHSKNSENWCPTSTNSQLEPPSLPTSNDPVTTTSLIPVDKLIPPSVLRVSKSGNCHQSSVSMMSTMRRRFKALESQPRR